MWKIDVERVNWADGMIDCVNCIDIKTKKENPMKRVLTVSLFLFVLFALVWSPRPTRAFGCATTKSGSIDGGGCIATEYTVCCEGPGPGEVSCFTYTVRECPPFIN